MQGRVLPGGSDWPLIRQDGASQFTASQQQGAAPQADPQASRQQHDQQAPRRDRPVAEQLPRPSGEQAEANASRHQGGLFA